MMYICLKLVEGIEIYDHRNRYELFYKEVNWPCVPIPKNGDIRISLGRDENKEETGWSIVPNSVWFDVNGDILIELQSALNPEIDPFDKFVQYLKNDGFLQRDEWYKLHPEN